MKHFHQIIIILITITTAFAGCITADVTQKIPEKNIQAAPSFEYTYNPSTIEYRADSDADGEIVTITFPFKNHIIKKDIAVSTEKYSALPEKNSEERTLYDGETDREKYDYFVSVAEDESGDEIYEQLVGFFDEYSEEFNLTRDEYVELAVSYVQNITYNSDSRSTKYPIETVYENNGDCDDKSILLSGLLSKKGYDTALLFFEKDSHMTAGIKGGKETEYPEADGYSMIETTGIYYIGEKSKTLRLGDNTSVTLSSAPSVYKIGSGVISYTAFDEVAEILEMREVFAYEVNKTDELMKETYEKINSGETLAKQITDTQKYNEYAETHNKYAYISNLITREPFNRAYVFSQVKSMGAYVL